MQRLSFLRETLRRARAEPLWGAAFVATLLLPWMMILAKVGIEACCAVIGLSFLWVSYRRRDWGWLRQPFAIACIAAWAWLSLVVTPLALKPEHSAVAALMWFRLPLMVIALRYYVLDTPAARTTVGAVLVVLLTLVAGDALWQYLTGYSFTGHARLDRRLTGPFVTPKVGLFMSKLLLPTLALCVPYVLAIKSKRLMVLGILLPTVVMVMILLSGERSATLSVMLAFSVGAGMMMLSERSWRAPCLAVAALVVTVLVVLYCTNDWIALRASQAMETMGNYWQSDYGLLANAAIEIGMDHLSHGVGLGNFRDLCPQLPYHGYTFTAIHPHNAYAEWFAETGLPGLLLFIAIIVTLLREGLQQFRRARGIERMLPALALGVCAQHFFPLMGMQSFFTNWPAMLVWFPLGLAFAGLPREKRA